jgi:type IV secretion system protein VirB2
MKILIVFSLAMMFSQFAMAEAASGDGAFTAACQNVSSFFGNFQVILKAVSIGIVTIAIVFAGYQIAFAHKRISDVAPILIGGLLIGGAATIATWFVGDFADDSCSEVTTTSELRLPAFVLVHRT